MNQAPIVRQQKKLRRGLKPAKVLIYLSALAPSLSLAEDDIYSTHLLYEDYGTHQVYVPIGGRCTTEATPIIFNSRITAFAEIDYLFGDIAYLRDVPTQSEDLSYSCPRNNGDVIHFESRVHGFPYWKAHSTYVPTHLQHSVDMRPVISREYALGDVPYGPIEEYQNTLHGSFDQFGWILEEYNNADFYEWRVEELTRIISAAESPADISDAYFLLGLTYMSAGNSGLDFPENFFSPFEDSIRQAASYGHVAAMYEHVRLSGLEGAVNRVLADDRGPDYAVLNDLMAEHGYYLFGAADQGSYWAHNLFSYAERGGLNLTHDGLELADTPTRSQIERALNERLFSAASLVDVFGTGGGAAMPVGSIYSCEGGWCSMMGIGEFRFALPDAVSCNVSGEGEALCDVQYRMLMRSSLERSPSGIFDAGDLGALIFQAASHSPINAQITFSQQDTGWTAIGPIGARSN